MDKYKLPGLVAAVALLFSCACLSPLSYYVGYLHGQRQQVSDRWGSTGEGKQATDRIRKQTEKLKKQNDLKAHYLKVAEDAEARGDGDAAAKAMRDLDDALRKLDGAEK